MAVVILLAACTSIEAPQRDGPVADAGSDELDPEEPRERGGTLRIGIGRDPRSIDPRFVADEPGEQVVAALFDPLVRLDDDLRVVPAAAEDWTISDDGRTFTFELREADFHDGTPVTASDFERTFSRIADGTADPRSFLAYLLEPVRGFERAQQRGGRLRGVRALDERTLRVQLREADPGFLSTLADPSLVPTPPAADEDPTAYGQRPIGNGAFEMSEAREPGAFLRLAGNSEHHDPPRLDEVVFQIYPDERGAERQWRDFEDDQLQVAELPIARRQEAVERFGTSEDGFTGPGVLDGITATTELYGFAVDVEPFDDPRVRRAVSLAIDRQALADEVLGGTRAPADAIVPPSLPGSQPNACEHCRHDPAAAREQLARSGASLGALTLTHSESPTNAAVAERIALDVAAALDIEVDVEPLELQRFVRTVRRGEAAVFRLGWEAETPDPGAYLEPLFGSESIGIDNYTGYANERVDELLDQARVATVPATANARWRRAERQILDDAAAVPLLWDRLQRVVAPEVQGLTYSPLGRADLSEVWVEAER